MIMKTSLFLVSILLGGSLFAQTANQADLSNSLLKQFNEEAKQQSVAPPISFMENKGQMHDQHYNPRPDVLFGAMAGNMAFHLKTTGVSYQLTRVDSYKEVEDERTHVKRKEVDQQTIYRVDLNWLNANSNLRTSTDQTLEGYNNYYLESCPNGALNVKSYTGVTVHNLYNGINLHYYEKEGQLKHDYIVAPGANYQQIQLKVEGATVRINEDGSLTLTTPLGKIIEGAPIVYQNGKQLKANWSLKNNTLGFEIENYNPNQELIIDPVTRLWGTYYGGITTDQGLSCASDAIGNVYMSGITGGAVGTAIATTGAHQTVEGGSNDAFLVKFDLNGIRQWGTYYGGSGSDQGTTCATDATGNVYLAGYANSNSGTAIATLGAHQPTHGGGVSDAFLMKFNSGGVRQWGTYYGGSGTDFGNSIAIDDFDNIYLAGTTTTAAATVIATAGSHQSAKGTGEDAFLVKFNSSGVRQWGTYYGGNAVDRGLSCAIDAMNNVYLAGATSSNIGTVIATSGAHQAIHGGGSNGDGFLVKFDPNGVRHWGTYYGSSAYDEVMSCATDAAGNVYISGYTASNTGTVIATAMSHQAVFGGGSNGDAFLAKFNASGTRQWGTYYGGPGNDYGQSCATDANGNIYLAGFTASNTGTVMATVVAHQNVYGGGSNDAYLVKFNSSGVRQWGTYYGGSGDEAGYSCATDATGSVYLAGHTSSNTAIATASAHQSVSAGSDAFLVKFSGCGPSETATVTQTACDSYTWALNGTTYTSSGTYTHVGTNASGCPLTTTLNLTINNSTTATVNQTACDSYTWALNGTTYTTSGTYTHVGTNASGCPLTTTLNLTINNSTTATVNQTACDSYTWALNGTTYTTSGTYTHVGTNASGCPLTTTLNLTFNNSTTATVSETACDSYTWPLNGTTYTTSGTYTHVGTNANGCPLTTTLNLTINNSTTATVTETACDSYTWALNGTTYTTSGTYSHVGTNAAGCPLTTTLNLTINNSTTATVNQTACDSYTWALNGTTYTTSGSYTHVGTNANGCPLTTTLNLTINNSTTATVTQTACDSYTWALNGTTYTTSGTYTHVGTNASGCPLITTLNLTINNSSTATVTETACDSYTWTLNGTTYTSSGTYIHVGTNASGCTLTTTLNLTINTSTTATVSETACDSYTWVLNGTTYTTSGTYTHVGTNASGCPLTTTLNLTINNSTTATVTETACNSYTWPLTGTTYTTSGNYTHVGTNANGCPLTTTLNLTINSVNVATSLSGNTITANASGASYQWIDCNNGNAIIPGATAQAFTPTANGSYAVIVTTANCSDTSACQAITTVGISEQNASAIEVYPNPTSGTVKVILGEQYQSASIQLFNALGQATLHKAYSSTNEITFEIEGAPGVYFLEIESAEQVLGRVRVVKN